jgi:serine/threonine protein kinase
MPMNEDSIFLEALQHDSAEARGAFLDQACTGNAQLRLSVEQLLRAHERADDVLGPKAEGLPVTATPCVTECIGTQVGPYKLLQQIGEGGFGVVFLAEQERPVRRKVALKIIKPGMDTRQVIARFEAERQALAMMDHPNIAKVYDAGATENGRPYFVMELVQGVPITEYCDQCNLTTRERLGLFITVCQAVQHAHQKGVIHRDIKPTNVLVAMQDCRPMPKIIDFGVAKAIGQRLTEHTLTTAFAQMVGSPLYMSPEQAELSPLGVDTRSDIYSLGVMLYELLTGATPFDKDRLHEASYDELRRIIRDEEPPRPSSRISTLAADLGTTVAEHRRTDARRLSQQVRGELDWIVMKCLEKDRNRRYETPNSLARDIERYLHDEPVQACPPSASYRFRKFARRNKTLLAAGGAIAAALVIGLGLSTWMYFRAAAERDRAKTISDLAQWSLPSLIAESAEAIVRSGIVDDEHDQKFDGQPAAEAEFAANYAWLADFLATTDRQEEANAVVRKAADHLAHAESSLSPWVDLKAHHWLAIAQLRLRDEAGYRESCVAMRDFQSDDDQDKCICLEIWCLGPHSGEDLSVQIKQAEELLAKHSANGYSGTRFVRWGDLAVIGGLLYRAGQYEQAAQRLEESLAAYPEDALRDFRTALDKQLLLAMTKWQLGQRDEARRLLAETLPAIDKWLQKPINTWMRRATIELIRREAVALIEQKEANEAVETKSPTNDERKQ